MRSSILFLFIALLSCTSNKDDAMQGNVATNETVKEATTTPQSDPADAAGDNMDDVEKNEKDADVDEVCVFDNDYRRVTSESLADKGINDFIWDDVNTRAVVVVETDTMYAIFGGCTHFGMTAEQVFRSNNVPLSDSAYWINHGLRLARLFDFEFYASEIEKGNVTVHVNGSNDVWFLFGDDNSEDNLFYDGIQVKEEGQLKVVSLSQYFN